MPEWSNQSDGFDCRQPHRTAVTTGAVGELDRELAGHRGSEEQLLFVGASFIGDGPKCVEVSAGIQSFHPQLLRRNTLSRPARPGAKSRPATVTLVWSMPTS
jgi:hypothetical protein